MPPKDAPSISPICAIPPATSCARRTRFRVEMGDDRAPAYVLTFSCVDAVGIVAAVTGLLAERDGFILDSQQYADLDSGRFFMRTEERRVGKECGRTCRYMGWT